MTKLDEADESRVADVARASGLPAVGVSVLTRARPFPPDALGVDRSDARVPARPGFAGWWRGARPGRDDRRYRTQNHRELADAPSARVTGPWRSSTVSASAATTCSRTETSWSHLGSHCTSPLSSAGRRPASRAPAFRVADPRACRACHYDDLVTARRARRSAVSDASPPSSHALYAAANSRTTSASTDLDIAFASSVFATRGRHRASRPADPWSVDVDADAEHDCTLLQVGEPAETLAPVDQRRSAAIIACGPSARATANPPTSISSGGWRSGGGPGNTE